MWLNTALFTAGILACLQLPQLPPFWLVLIALLLALAYLLLLTYERADHIASDSPLLLALQSPFRAWLQPGAFFLAGLCWAAVDGHLALAERLNPKLISQDLLIEGQVVNLPEPTANGWRFDFAPANGSLQGHGIELPARLRLGWYREPVSLRGGQYWRLVVRLKPPTSTANPGLFDYEDWLFQQGIGARGYVRNDPRNELLQRAGGLNWHSLREQLRQVLLGTVTAAEIESGTGFGAGTPSPAMALWLALTLGDRSAIDAELWQVFRRTGISHLVAISGLHVGIVAGLSFWLAGLAWRRSAWLCWRYPAPVVQAWAALLAAFFYAGLAGFALATQRALLMLAVVVLARLLLINLQPARQFVLAWFAVLIHDPPAVHSPGFWLSFIAVFAIYRALSSSQDRAWPVRLVSMQWSITLWLLPLSLFWFDAVSLVSPLVNLLLVPLFSVLVVPAALLLAFLHSLAYSLADSLADSLAQFLSDSLAASLELATAGFLHVMEWGIDGLAQVAALPLASLQPALPGWLLPLLVIFAWVWHVPALPYWRWLFLALVLALVIALGPGLGLGMAQLTLPSAWRLTEMHQDAELTVLDVGQGLAVVFRQHDKVMLYDAGPRYGGQGSATASIVLPWLEKQGIRQLDTLVISHLDGDHAGHFALLEQAMSVSNRLAGELTAKMPTFRGCQAGQQWHWEQTRFEVLSPLTNGATGNNASCVIRIETAGRVILLTGDIEASVERKLLAANEDKLRSDILIAPHHGSGTSSSLGFVQATRPALVLNSSAYLNRYGFPLTEVRRRWEAEGSRFLDTGQHGALQVRLDAKTGNMQVSAWRLERKRFWHWLRQ